MFFPGYAFLLACRPLPTVPEVPATTCSPLDWKTLGSLTPSLSLPISSPFVPFYSSKMPLNLVIKSTYLEKLVKLGCFGRGTNVLRSLLAGVIIDENL